MGMWFNIALIVFIILGLVAFLWRRLFSNPKLKHRLQQRLTVVTGGKAAPTTLCDRPNCVRCSRNITTRQNAAAMMKSKFSHEPALERIRQAFEVDTIKDGSGYLLNIPGLMSKNLWMGSISRDKHHTLIEDINNIPMDWREILTEYKDLDDDDCWSFNCATDGQKTWKMLSLINQGAHVTFNCSRMPRTNSMLELLNNLMTNCSLGNAFISVLPPGTSIAAHTGPTNARLRCHLPIVVPRTCNNAQCDCAIIVANQRVHWHVGECLLFDDSMMHAVEYTKLCEKHADQSSTERVVLVIDLWHPDLSAEERKCIETLFPLA